MVSHEEFRNCNAENCLVVNLMSSYLLVNSFLLSSGLVINVPKDKTLRDETEGRT